MNSSEYFCRYFYIFSESPSRGILEFNLGVSLVFTNTVIKTIKKMEKYEKTRKSTELQNQITIKKMITNNKFKSNNGKKRPNSPSELQDKRLKQKTKNTREST